MAREAWPAPGEGSIAGGRASGGYWCRTGTAQPPFPLQEFFPAQPLSPVLHPPCALHSFFAAHECLAAVAHPPFILQEFFPAQPLSPEEQPPFPLQEFIPLQAC